MTDVSPVYAVLSVRQEFGAEGSDCGCETGGREQVLVTPSLLTEVEIAFPGERTATVMLVQMQTTSDSVPIHGTTLCRDALGGLR